MAGIYRISFRFYLARWSLCREKATRVRRAGKRIAANKRKKERENAILDVQQSTQTAPNAFPKEKKKLYASYQSIGVCVV